MTWQPQQEGLDEVLAMLRQTSSPDSEVQKNITLVSDWPGFTAVPMIAIYQCWDVSPHPTRIANPSA
jgi:hypothetical protein